jgi:phenylacetate-CoA ligase
MFRHKKKQLTVQLLASLDPKKLEILSERRTLKTFQRAAISVPAYKQCLKDFNVSIAAINTIQDFKKNVPILDKNKTFRYYSQDFKKLCVAGDIKNVSNIVVSSGHSAESFSYGLSTAKETQKMQEAIDFTLDYIFDVSEKKTLLINGLPMGVHIHSSLVTVADTSVRSDIIITVIKTFASAFEQLILVGENSFVKKVLEEGIASGIDWKKIKIHLVLGEEILPENLRVYFANILGINPDMPEHQSIIGSSFGLAEIGLNVFHETKELIRIRRLMQRDRRLKEKLVGADLENLPAFFQYNPLRVFVEEMPKANNLSDIVLTNLDEDTNIPLVRYNTQDEGKCVSYEHLKETLTALGYGNYVPHVRLPLVAIWGREKLLLEEGFYLRPEFVKELLYSDDEIAPAITGNFKLSNSKAGLRIEVQLKNEVSNSEGFEARIRTILLANIPARTEIILYPYRDFPHGLELNYERKFRYI